MKQFQIHREDIGRTRVVDTPDPEPGPGEALLSVQHFGFTANNMTYAVLGDQLGYWQFFPATDEPDQWGVVPVWGFAKVIAEQDSVLEVGERLFGYFPTATHLMIQPQGDPGRTVVDTTPHRAALPAAYNSYQRAAADADRMTEDLRMLLFPLYLTSWAIGDMLGDKGFFGAEQVLVASASSKTALGVAYAIRAAANPPALVGLTSAANRDWVEGLGLYDRVVVYDDVETEIEKLPTVIVDMAGNGRLLGRLHTHLAEAMRRTVSVGITHWEDFGAHPDVIGERTEFFFAPTVIAARIEQWGAGEFVRRSEAFISEAATASAGWLSIVESAGIDALPELYAEVRTGAVDPSVGSVVRV